MDYRNYYVSRFGDLGQGFTAIPRKISSYSECGCIQSAFLAMRVARSREASHHALPDTCQNDMGVAAL